MANDSFVSVFSSENRANIAVYPLDVFVLTDNGTAQIRGGADGYITKPFERQVMLDGIRAVLGIEG